MKKTEHRIEFVPLGQLKLHGKNPKRHALLQIKESFSRFGFIAPVIINEENNTVLAGHGRIAALREKKSEGSPAPRGIKIVAGEWLVPCVNGVTLSEREHEAYLIADNRLTELGDWDDENLAAMLQQIEAEEGLSGTGYSYNDLAKLLKAQEEQASKLVSEDGVEISGMALVPFEHWDYIVLMFRDSRDWISALELLNIGKAPINFPTDKSKRKLGIGRVIDGAKALSLLMTETKK